MSYVDLKEMNPVVSFKVDSDFFVGEESLRVTFPIGHLKEFAGEDGDTDWDKVVEAVEAYWLWELKDFVVDYRQGEAKYFNTESMYWAWDMSDLYARSTFNNFNYEPIPMVLHMDGAVIYDEHGEEIDQIEGLTFETPFIWYDSKDSYAENMETALIEYDQNWNFRGIK